MSTVLNINFEEGLTLAEFLGAGIVLKIKVGSHPKVKTIDGTACERGACSY